MARPTLSSDDASGSALVPTQQEFAGIHVDPRNNPLRWLVNQIAGADVQSVRIFIEGRQLNGNRGVAVGCNMVVDWSDEQAKLLNWDGVLLCNRDLFVPVCVDHVAHAGVSSVNKTRGLLQSVDTTENERNDHWFSGGQVSDSGVSSYRYVHVRGSAVIHPPVEGLTQTVRERRMFVGFGLVNFRDANITDLRVRGAFTAHVWASDRRVFEPPR